MKSERIIYSLSCPFTDNIHYIGKTTKGMIRPLSHLSKSHSEKVREWVSELKELGHAPKVNVLEYVSLNEDLDGREKYWIQYRLNKGDLLLNDISVTPMLIHPDLDKIIGESNEQVNLIFARFIKEKRKQTGHKQEDFANRSGVALTVLRKIEQGKTNINLDGLLQILKMFGCTLAIKKI